MASKGHYNFKSVTVVPSGKDFVDIVLSRTQRKTPTVIHKNFKLSRIRNFYTRKVKYTQQTFHDKLTAILEEFPKLDDVHPFYADLMNVLYDKDHYKLALGQINTCRHLVDNVAKDYVRLLKYGDSLYRCKQLKRAALGRMCTIMSRQNSTLAYLEEVRQHLARLPSIDPTTRTLIVTGFPNVGKSSFVNKITRADVEVQPYAFTTKSLFVGHTDFKYLRWQVIDTPGILDHPLEQRNTIEMQAITALAHLRAAVLYVMDLSEQCGHTVAEQLSLFENIRPLFANKPLVIVVNKVDIVGLDSLPDAAQEPFRRFASEGIDILPMSTLQNTGVADVKNTACQKLLDSRVDSTLKGRKVEDIVNRLHLAQPVARDNKSRPPFIPPNFHRKSTARAEYGLPGVEVMDEDEASAANRRPTLRDQELAEGEDFFLDLQAEWDLKNPEWKKDVIPEIMDGKNIADFIDPDIMLKIEQLEAEEEAQEAIEDEEDPLSLEALALRDQANLIRERKIARAVENRLRKSRTNAPIPRNKKHININDELEAEREQETRSDYATTRSRSQSVGRSSSKQRDRSVSMGPAKGTEGAASRALSKVRVDSKDAGMSTVKQKLKAKSLKRLGQRPANVYGRAGEADRHISEAKPRHLYSGKRGKGKTDHR